MANSLMTTGKIVKPVKGKDKTKGKASSSPVPSLGSSSDRESMNIRKIENGFIVRHTCDGKDGYQETEWYTDKKPDIGMPKGK